MLMTRDDAISILTAHLTRCGENDDPRASTPSAVVDYAYDCESHLTDDDDDEVAEAIRTICDTTRQPDVPGFDAALNAQQEIYAMVDLLVDDARDGESEYTNPQLRAVCQILVDLAKTLDPAKETPDV